MSDVNFTLRALADIQDFVEYVQDYFYRFYSNTGIDNVKEIQDAYSSDTKVLFVDIRDEIIWCLMV
jgi:hypothetical protein